MKDKQPQDKTRRVFFVLLMLLAVFLMTLLIHPLFTELVVAAVLAGVLWPLQKRLTRRLRGRQSLSAGILCTATVLIAVGPMTGFAVFAVNEAVTGVSFVSDALNREGPEGLVEKTPKILQAPVRAAVEKLHQQGGATILHTLQTKANEQAAKVLALATGALAATGGFLFDAVIMLTALYFFLVQGDELVRWFDSVLPLGPGQTLELMEEFKKTSYAVVVSTTGTAAIATVIAFIGYLIARVPHVVFFLGLTFFAALIPAVGATVISLLAALVLLLLGHPYLALFLALWSMVIPVVEHLVKPLLMRGGMDLSGGVVFFSLIGGLSAFGPIGIALGPLIVAFFVSLLRMYQREKAEI